MEHWNQKNSRHLVFLVLEQLLLEGVSLKVFLLDSFLKWV